MDNTNESEKFTQLKDDANVEKLIKDNDEQGKEGTTMKPVDEDTDETEPVEEESENIDDATLPDDDMAREDDVETDDDKVVEQDKPVK